MCVCLHEPIHAFFFWDLFSKVAKKKSVSSTLSRLTLLFSIRFVLPRKYFELYIYVPNTTNSISIIKLPRTLPLVSQYHKLYTYLLNITSSISIIKLSRTLYLSSNFHELYIYHQTITHSTSIFSIFRSLYLCSKYHELYIYHQTTPHAISIFPISRTVSANYHNLYTLNVTNSIKRGVGGDIQLFRRALEKA